MVAAILQSVDDVPQAASKSLSRATGLGTDDLGNHRRCEAIHVSLIC